MTTKLTPDELFLEFALTDSPFDKWRILSHITDEATFIYLPNHKQSHLCNLQFGIYELLNSDNERDIQKGKALLRWLASGQKHVSNYFGTTAPAAFYLAYSKLTPAQISEASEKNRNLFLLFNPKKLSFREKNKSLVEKLMFWRS
ncbi:hypothetical protein GVT90_16985 [Salmonella enterica]|nr:hypothetical protein [Salmonella enterica]